MHLSISKPQFTSRLTRLARLGATVGAAALAGCSRSDEPSGSTVHHDVQEEDPRYQSEVRTRPAKPLVGEPVTLHFTVRDRAGRPVRELPRSHEKPLHVLLVSKDLRYFAHLHPAADGDSYRVEHRFETGGEYLVFADYQQPGRGQIVDRHALRVGGTAPPPAPLVETSRTQRAAGLELTLRTEGDPRGTETVQLHFDVTDEETGLPAADLEPYLGARAHFLVLSEDGEDFVHAHALEGGGAARLSAHAVFPRAGRYKIWVQTQRRGEVVTVPFVLRVGPPPPAPTSESNPSDAHATHPH